ncbi:AAA family ATPase [Candidatus Symbiothrix dinenymphae]|uniref:AAA family ATPase n=1 Tax=Candidatus Symbiothrix dinenymphae TaxID=467085 RepID=UPI0006E1DD11|nr:ATP-binding protein [Candidatus Symbiothrix dinenymphae]
MIIKFTVGNFLSFNERRTLDFEAQGISELKQNVISSHNLLRSIVVYGANSSGKSNLIKALHLMRDLVLNSVKLNDSDELEFTPFLLSAENKNTPTFFEVIFIKENKKFRYGFEYSQTKIVNEWLFTGKSSKTEKALFIRTQEGIGVSAQFEEGQGKEEATNDNRLFISLVAQLGGVISKQIMECFRNYAVLSGVTHKDYSRFSLNMLRKKLAGSKESLSLFQTLKLGFKDVQIIESEFTPTDLPKSIPKNMKDKLAKEMPGATIIALKTIHNKYDKNGKITDTVLLDSVENESEGTKKIMDLSGPIFDTLLLGNVLIIDELDSKLHPLITIQIVNLFNDPQTNPNNAQLLFATHDTNLLNADLFRRDQVWFTEKDDREQTDLYSLYDFNLPDGSKVRNDANLEKNYIRGRYGAIPFITN